MAISDIKEAKVIATVPIGMGVDGAGFDPSTGDAFATNADGTLTVVHQDATDQYRVVQTLTTPVRSRNLGLDPSRHPSMPLRANRAASRLPPCLTHGNSNISTPEGA